MSSAKDVTDYVRSLIKEGIVKMRHGDFQQALQKFTECERIARQEFMPKVLVDSLCSQAEVLYMMDDELHSREKAEEAEKVAREERYYPALASILCGKGVQRQRRNDLEGAMNAFMEAEHICRETGDLNGLAQALVEQGVVLSLLGAHDAAQAAYQHAETFYRSTKNKHGLENVLRKRASIQRGLHDNAGALALFKEAGELAEEMNNHEARARSLDGQALVLADLGQWRDAMKAMFDAFTPAAVANISSLMQQIESDAKKLIRRVADNCQHPLEAAEWLRCIRDNRAGAMTSVDLVRMLKLIRAMDGGSPSLLVQEAFHPCEKLDLIRTMGKESSRPSKKWWQFWK